MDTCKLRGAMAEKGYNGTKLAEALGMNIETMRRKLRSGNFSVDDAIRICDILEIDDPIGIFFLRNK